MKRVIIFSIIVLISIFSEKSNAETDLENNNISDKKIENTKSFGRELISDGLIKNSIKFFGGYHEHLYGYTDVRYKGDDQGDYIKTDSEHFGFELIITDFSDLNKKLNNGRFGINVNGYRHGKIGSRTLYDVATNSNISEETVPENYYDQTTRFWFNIGVFVGFSSKWWGTDLGLTFELTGFDEEYREKLTASGTPVYEKVDGRGLVWENAGAYLNFFLRLGMQDRAHFEFSAFRDDYDPVYGIVQTKLVFPITSFFTFKMGGYLYQTSAAFIEPVFLFKGFSIGLKFGSIINYGDDSFTKVGITDSFIYSASISYEW